MAVLEVLTINLGAALIKVTAKAWLGDTWAEAAVAPLTETLKKAIPDFETRWAAEQLFTDLQNKVAHRLATVIERLFPAMPENEQRAAILAVADIFERISIQKDIFESDLDAIRLEAIARVHTQQCFRMLGSETEAFARFILRESCNFAVALAGKMPNFQVAATGEILKRHREPLILRRSLKPSPRCKGTRRKGEYGRPKTSRSSTGARSFGGLIVLSFLDCGSSVPARASIRYRLLT